MSIPENRPRAQFGFIHSVPPLLPPLLDMLLRQARLLLPLALPLTRTAARPHRMEFLPQLLDGMDLLPPATQLRLDMVIPSLATEPPSQDMVPPSSGARLPSSMAEATRPSSTRMAHRHNLAGLLLWRRSKEGVLG